MSRAITGQPFRRHWDVSGTVTASTAPVLWITPPGGSAASSGASVTWTTSVAGRVTASVSLAGVAVESLVEFRGGSVTIGGTAYDIASDVVLVETAQHRLAGVTVANAVPVAYDLKLASGHGALVAVGDRLWMGNKWRRLTAKGSGASADEITLDDETGLAGTTGGDAYVIAWESGRLSGTGLSEIEIEVLSALNTHGVATGGDVTAVSNKIGTPANASVSADIAAVKASADSAASNASAAASNASSAASNASTAASSASTAASNASTAASNASTAATNAGNAASTASAINTKLGTPVGVSVSADIAAAKASADTAASNASTAASNASTAASNASTAASNASTAATNAGNAANTASTINTAISHASNGLAAIRAALDAFAGKFNGITSVLNFWRAALRKSTPDPTALGEINGIDGTYNATTDSLEAIRDRGDAAWLSGSGGGSGPAGAFAQTITVRRSDTNALVPNAVVRIGDAGVAWTGTTNGSGVASIGVDAGTYTITVSAAGFAYTPTAKTVVGVEAFELLVVPNAITPASEPGKTTAHTAVFGGPARFHFELLDPTPVGSTTPATSWSLAPITVDVTTASLEVELYRSARYRVRRDAGGWVEFTTTDTATFALPETLSQRRSI